MVSLVSKLCKILHSHNEIVVGYERNVSIRDEKNAPYRMPDVTSPKFYSAYQDEEFDFIIHLVAKTSIEESINNPFNTYFTNIGGTLNLLEFARKKHINNIIFLSTYLYGQPEYLPIDENHPLKPHSPYNKSKFLAEKLCEYYSIDYGINVVCLRPFSVYGPGNKESSLIQKTIARIIEGECVLLKGAKIKRDLLFIDDFVELIQKILVNFPKKYNIYNVGYGTSYDLREVVKKISQLMNREITIQFESVENEIQDIVADISKVSEVFKWKPKTNLDLGLQLILHEIRKE